MYYIFLINYIQKLIHAIEKRDLELVITVVSLNY